MRNVRRKLGSQAGASITFALLLFLVCAVISSVVIVAATAAGGRLSKLAEMDQRYYAVTSAAELLRHEIDGKTVIVTQSKDAEGNPVYTARYKDADADAEDILADASARLVRGNTDAQTFALTATGIADAALDCTIAETVGADRLLTFDISNKDGTAGSIYRLRLVFTPNIRTSAPDADGSVKTTLTWSFQSLKKTRGGVTS